MPLLREFHPCLEKGLFFKSVVQRCLHCLGKMQMGQPCSRIHSGQGNFKKKVNLHSWISLNTTQGLKGLTAPAIKNKVALRVSLTGSIFMDAVQVSHDALLPKSKGLGSPFSCLNSARCVVLTWLS